MGLRVGLRIPHFLRLTPDSGNAALLTFICPWLLNLVSRDLLLDLSPRFWNEVPCHVTCALSNAAAEFSGSRPKILLSSGLFLPTFFM